MKTYKNYLALILGVIMIFALAACGGGDSAEPAAEGEETEVTEEAEEAEGAADVDVAAAYNKILEGLNAEAADSGGDPGCRAADCGRCRYRSRQR